MFGRAKIQIPTKLRFPEQDFCKKLELPAMEILGWSDIREEGLQMKEDQWQLIPKTNVTSKRQ